MKNLHHWFLYFIRLAGFPPTIAYSGKSLVNTLPIPTMVPVLICLPGVSKEFIPIQQSSSIIVSLSSLKPCLTIGISVSSNRWFLFKIKQLRDKITLFPMIMLDGISVLAPIPDPSPITTFLPLPKRTLRLIVCIEPHSLKIRLHRATLSRLANLPPKEEYESGRYVAKP